MSTPKELLRANFIFSLAIITGACIFLIVALVVNNMIPKEDLPVNIFLGVVGLTAVLCLVNALTIYKKRLNTILEKNLSLVQRLTEYRALLILYFALCEGPALFAVIMYMLTGVYWFIIIFSVMLIMMLMKLPVKKKVISELQLDWQEQQEL